MLMEIGPLPMRGALVMTMVLISPRVLDWFRLVAAKSRPESLLMIFSSTKDSI